MIYNFLGVSPFLDKNVRNKLDPVNSKINSLKIYEMIPNCEAIDERFGSDETGWLKDGA